MILSESEKRLKYSSQKKRKVYLVKQCQDHLNDVNSDQSSSRKVKTQKMSDASGPPSGPPIFGKPFKIFTDKNQALFKIHPK